jgi:glycosyltransferase involved in cell wall biosynthesis
VRSKLSIIVPVFNEESGIPRLFDELESLAHSLVEKNLTVQVVFVDNCSTDASWRILRSSIDGNNSFEAKAIQHFSNLGMQESLITGLRNSDGDAVVVLQSDLQDPIDLVLSMADEWINGANYVATRIEGRDDPISIRIGSWFFYRGLSFVSTSPVIMDSSDFYLFSSEIKNQVLQRLEIKPFLRTILSSITSPDVVLGYRRNARQEGLSNYNHVGRAAFAGEAYLSNLSAAASKGAVVASVFALISLISIASIIIAYVFNFRSDVSGWASTTSIIFFLGSINLFLLSIILELTARIYKALPRTHDSLPVKVYEKKNLQS